MDERLVSNNSDHGRDTSGLRTVVINRTDRGYGLVVSGESPVIVQDVKDGGPAALSGVNKGDSIIKVNDTLVSKSNHKNVVDIIKSAPCVKLTLQSREAEITSLPIDSHKGHSMSGMKSRDLITRPFPINTHLQTILDESKVKMLQRFLDKEGKVRDSLVAEMQKNQSKALRDTLDEKLKSVEKQMSTISEEIRGMKDPDSQSASQNSRYVNRSVAHPHAYHPYQQHTRSVSELPPPLPARNRHLASQTSAPSGSNSVSSSACVPSGASNYVNTGGAPPLPPRHTHMERLGDSGHSHSLENIPKVSNLVHSNSSGSDTSSRQSHHRVKSSPDPLGLQHSAAAIRLSGCEIGGEGATWMKMPSFYEDMPPPGTPPPPYLGSSGAIAEDDNSYSVIPEDCAFKNENRPVPGYLGISSGYNHPPEQLPNSRSSFSILGSRHNGKYQNRFGSQVTSPSTPSDQGTSPLMQMVDNWNSSILTMEDEDGDIVVDDHGPFQSLKNLMSDKNNAYLAVFTNYLVSNCDPSSLFFYIITALYKEGGAKEMKKWAYEIHSSFLLPGAPMKMNNIDEGILHEIDETLQNELDKEEILRKIFWKARQRARDDLNEQLADFRSKRSAGLGTLFGPSDVALEETVHNKVKELQVVEDLLVPFLDSVSEDLKNQTDHLVIMASSFATILWKCFNVKGQQAQALIDKCPLFVNKDRPLRSKLLKNSKKQVVRDHHFNLVTFYSVNHCNHCGFIIWGIAPQGYQCTNCEMNIHKVCVKLVEETCVGQVHRIERSRDTKFSSFLLKIMPEDREKSRKASQVNAAQIERARRGLEDTDVLGPFLDCDGIPGDKNSGSGSKEQRRSDPGGATSLNHQASSGSFDDDSHLADEADHSAADQPTPLPYSDIVSNNLIKAQGGHKKRSSSSINRSESCKEKQHSRKQTRENRKNSDPNIPTSKTNDVDGENPLNFQSGSSSNSSLSQSQESPSNCVEQVQAYASALDNDSDIETEPDLPDWTCRISVDDLENLSAKDRKRQDTINELFHTEQSHVRVLKVLQSLFYQPLRQSCYLLPELLDRLFPNLDQMLKFHVCYNKAMKKRRQETPLVVAVGDIVTSMFVGDDGIQFQQAAGEFVAYQGGALDDLKQRQKRDQKLAVFLQDQENHHHCRRLQLKDMLPAGFQRLTKYPLLLESLLSYTDRNKQQEEYDQIAKALEKSKETLAYVNASVEDAENHRRLIDIQKRLDQTSLAKNKHGNCEELRGELDLTKHNLIYEGPLTWKTRGQKNIDIHVLILEDCVVLLQKDSDKFVLKYHSINKASGKDDNKLNHSPIIKFGTFIFRPNAADKCAFFIVLTQSTLGAQIYELVTISHNERNVWLRHLHDAQSAYESREGRNRRSHPPPLPDNDESSAANDQLREVDDNADNEATEAGESSRAPEVADIPSNSTNQTDSPPDKAESGSKDVGPAPRSRRLQEVQIIQIVEGPALIDPSEVKISQGVVLSAEPVLTPIELLRRKDLKIRQELEEKQNLIADILNIPREDFESVADMASEAGITNRDAKELVLGALYQAKKLQETLNEAQSINVPDIVAAQAAPKSSTLPLYQAPMEKLLNISGALNQLLDSLLGLVSERDDERERMRKELIAARERTHQKHAEDKDGPVDTTVTPYSSRPNSCLSATSSGTDNVEVTDKPQETEVKEDSKSCKPVVPESTDVPNESSLNDVIPPTNVDVIGDNAEAYTEPRDSTCGQIDS